MKINFIKALCLSCLSVFTITSCGESKDNDFTIEVTPETVNSVPTGRRSCVALRDDSTDVPSSEDLTANSFKFSSFQFSWQNVDSRQLRLEGIIIKLNDSRIDGGQYTCTIAGDELVAMFPLSADSKFSGWRNGQFTKSTTITYVPSTSGSASGIVKFDDNLQAQDYNGATVTLCSPRCGGLKIKTTSEVVISGTVEVFGSSVGTDGGERAEFADTSFELLYTPGS